MAQPRLKVNDAPAAYVVPRRDMERLERAVHALTEVPMSKDAREAAEAVFEAFRKVMVKV